MNNYVNAELDIIALATADAINTSTPDSTPDPEADDNELPIDPA